MWRQSIRFPTAGAHRQGLPLPAIPPRSPAAAAPRPRSAPEVRRRETAARRRGVRSAPQGRRATDRVTPLA
ncbi:hypothetical protein SQ03_12305 [Methylobacterium platani JCM 14648]|uniref:Uncharacterized protein n=1 Tax=Methylobacterium platani JCM 14648 TaxID=1295136 RepID=A0ABR5H2I3_9HYPH|nr:hypothetical protein SQ03_12305 [Methylobacterium platani JCM 14648]